MSTTPTPQPLGYRPEQVAALTGLSRTTVFALLKSGELESRKIGKARIVLARSVEKLLEGGE